jgi:hypothetical protein
MDFPQFIDSLQPSSIITASDAEEALNYFANGGDTSKLIRYNKLSSQGEELFYRCLKEDKDPEFIKRSIRDRAIDFIFTRDNLNIFGDNDLICDNLRKINTDELVEYYRDYEHYAKTHNTFDPAKILYFLNKLIRKVKKN